MLLTFVLLFAQLGAPQTSHFQRLKLPWGKEWKDFQKLDYQGEFALPKSGKYTIDYQKLYPADYASKTFPVVCNFDDRIRPGYGNQIPIYDIDESYDHITVQAKPGSHWWYSCTIAVRKK